MGSSLALPLLLFSPLAAAFLSLLGKLFSSTFLPKLAFALWVSGTIAGLILSAQILSTGQSIIYRMGGWSEPYGITNQIQGPVLIATLADLLIAGAAWLQTRRFRRYDQIFSFFFFLALFSLQGIMLTRDLFNLFVWFEVLSLCSFILIAYFKSPTSMAAAIRYLLISSVSVFFYLVGLWILYSTTGSLSLETIGSSLNGAVESTNIGSSSFGAAASGGAGLFGINGSLGLALAFLTAAMLTKAAIIPFHTWLPDAHSAAPYPVSALLSGFVIKAPMIALWIIFDYINFPALGEVFVWLGAAGALAGVLAAMVQKDAKKLLAYHSVSQMGYIIAAFGAGGSPGKTAALFYIVGHALFKGLLFLTVGEVTDRAGNRNVYELRGLFRFFPYQGVLFFVAAASIAGVPLFAGYSAKLLVTGTLYSHPAYTLLFLAGIGTAASFFKLGRIFIGKTGPWDSERLEIEPPDMVVGGSAAGAAHFSATLLGLGCMVMGIIPWRVSRFFYRAVENGLSGDPVPVLPDFFSISPLLKAGFSLVLGFALSLLLLRPMGKRISHFLRGTALRLNGALRLLVVGFLLFALFGAFFYP